MEIRVYNTSYELIGMIESADSFYWIDRYNEPGEFEIYTQVSPELISLLAIDNYLKIPESNKAMIIETIRIKTDAEEGSKLIVRGRSLESILDRRIVWTQTLLDNVTIEAGIFQVLSDAFITGVSNANRILSNFITTASGDTSITSIMITTQLDAENILDLVESMTGTYELGFQIHFTASNQFEFKLYNGKDRSFTQSTNPHVIFSPNFDNLANSEFVMSKRPYKNYALWVGDESETTALVRGYQYSDGAIGFYGTGLVRRETYLDQQRYSRFIQGTGTAIDPTKYTGQMFQIAKQSLEDDYAMYSAFDGVADTTTGAEFGVDYFLGDIVQIENEYGMTARSRITEMTYSEDGSGIRNYPTFTNI